MTKPSLLRRQWIFNTVLAKNRSEIPEPTPVGLLLDFKASDRSGVITDGATKIKTMFSQKLVDEYVKKGYPFESLKGGMMTLKKYGVYLHVFTSERVAEFYVHIEDLCYHGGEGSSVNWTVDFSHDNRGVRDRIIKLLEQHSILEDGKVTLGSGEDEVREYPIFENLGVEKSQLSQELDSTQEEPRGILGDISQNEEAYLVSETQQAEIQRLIREPEPAHEDDHWDNSQEAQSKNSPDEEKDFVSGNPSTGMSEVVVGHNELDEGLREETTPESTKITHSQSLEAFISPLEPHICEDRVIATEEELVVTSSEEPPAKRMKRDEEDTPQPIIEISNSDEMIFQPVVEISNSARSSLSDEFIISATQTAQLASKVHVDLAVQHSQDIEVVVGDQDSPTNSGVGRDVLVVDLNRECDRDVNGGVDQEFHEDTTASYSAKEKDVVGSSREGIAGNRTNKETSQEEEKQDIENTPMSPAAPERVKIGSEDSLPKFSQLEVVEPREVPVEEAIGILQGLNGRERFQGGDNSHVQPALGESLPIEESHTRAGDQLVTSPRDGEDNLSCDLTFVDQLEDKQQTEQILSTKIDSPLSHSDQQGDTKPIDLTTDDKMHEVSDITHISDSGQSTVPNPPRPSIVLDNALLSKSTDSGRNQESDKTCTLEENMTVEGPSVSSGHSLPPFQVPRDQVSPPADDTTACEDSEEVISPDPTTEKYLLTKIVNYWRQRHLESPVRSNLLFQFLSTHRSNP